MAELLAQLNSEMASLVAQVQRSLVQIRNGRHGMGAGIIWRPDGLIVTNAHVVGQPAPAHVFPDGDLVSVSDALVIAETAGFEVRDVEGLREHYARTLRLWVQRLEARRAEAVKLVGEAKYRTWRIFMAGCAYAFADGRISVFQALLAKPDAAGAVALPWSRADIYESL